MDPASLGQNEAPSSQPTFQRWYEKNPTLAKSIRMLQMFPSGHQTLLASTIIALVKRQTPEDTLLSELSGLDPDKVLSLFKAKNKNRSYDQCETSYQAMNYLFILPDQERLNIATQLIDVVSHLLEYVAICQATGQTLTLEIMESITQAYVTSKDFKNTTEHLSHFCPSMHLPNGPTLHSIRTQLFRAKETAFEEEIQEFYPVLEKVKFSKTENSDAGSIKLASEKNSIPTALQPELTPKIEQEPKEKDELLAQDQCGMKIKLDKFDL